MDIFWFFSGLFCFLLTVQFEGRHGDRVFDRRELQFEIGEGDNYDLPHGLEKAIQKMEKLEESVFYLKPKYAVSDILILEGLILSIWLEWSAFQRCSKNLIIPKSLMHEKYEAKITLPLGCEVVAL